MISRDVEDDSQAYLIMCSSSVEIDRTVSEHNTIVVNDYLFSSAPNQPKRGHLLRTSSILSN